MDDISIKKREIEEKLKQVNLTSVKIGDVILVTLNDFVLILFQEKLTLSFLKDSLTKSDQITHNMVGL